MPAGSGPMVVQGTANQSLAGTGEVAVATFTGSWQNPNGLGNLLSAVVTATSTGAATLTLRIRQGGAGLGGGVVGSAVIYAFAGAATTVPIATQQVDVSAFANGPQTLGQYTLSAQASVGSTITLVNSLLEAETIAPIL